MSSTERAKHLAETIWTANDLDNLNLERRWAVIGKDVRLGIEDD